MYTTQSHRRKESDGMEIVLTIFLVFVIAVLIMCGILLFPLVTEAIVDGIETIEEFKRKRGKRK